MLCSKCSTLQVSSLNVSPIFWWKVFSLLDAAFSMANLDLICIICYHATHTVEIFHILQVFLIYHTLYCGWFPADYVTLVLFTCTYIPQHLLMSISLSIMPCSTVSSSASSTKTSAHFTVNYLSFCFAVAQPFNSFSEQCSTHLPTSGLTNDAVSSSENAVSEW